MDLTKWPAEVWALLIVTMTVILAAGLIATVVYLVKKIDAIPIPKLKSKFDFNDFAEYLNKCTPEAKRKCMGIVASMSTLEDLSIYTDVFNTGTTSSLISSARSYNQDDLNSKIGKSGTNNQRNRQHRDTPRDNRSQTPESLQNRGL